LNVQPLSMQIPRINKDYQNHQQSERMDSAGDVPVTSGPSVLELDIKELENAIEHLERSNRELENFIKEDGPDDDLAVAVDENIKALAIKRCRLAKLRDILEKAQSGETAAEAPQELPINLPPAIGDGTGKTPVLLTHQPPVHLEKSPVPASKPLDQQQQDEMVKTVALDPVLNINQEQIPENQAAQKFKATDGLSQVNTGLIL